MTNSTAVAFTQAFIQKYIDYFAAKGCKYFNFGADEYANDRYTSGLHGLRQPTEQRQIRLLHQVRQRALHDGEERGP